MEFKQVCNSLNYPLRLAYTHSFSDSEEKLQRPIYNPSTLNLHSGYVHLQNIYFAFTLRPWVLYIMPTTHRSLRYHPFNLRAICVSSTSYLRLFYEASTYLLQLIHYRSLTHLRPVNNPSHYGSSSSIVGLCTYCGLVTLYIVPAGPWAWFRLRLLYDTSMSIWRCPTTSDIGPVCGHFSFLLYT